MLKRLQPSLVARRLWEVDLDALAAQGIQGVVLDLDNTLTPWRSLDVPAEAQAWLRSAQAAGLRACLVSNAATARRVQPVADQFGIPWVTRAIKPLPRGYWRAMQVMQTTPETTAAIGDQIFTDIFGGNRLGLLTILVDPMSDREAIVTKMIQRPLERLIGRRCVT
ncbi:MAG: YqeG family HAD IIIA-type phosphatase [Armatimonadota bacterium]